MDGLKLDKWRKTFETEAKALQIKYDAFLLPRKFDEVYQLRLDETNHTLYLWVDSNIVPEEIQNGLAELLLKTEPEDSV